MQSQPHPHSQTLGSRRGAASIPHQSKKQDGDKRNKELRAMYAASSASPARKTNKPGGFFEFHKHA